MVQYSCFLFVIQHLSWSHETYTITSFLSYYLYTINIRHVLCVLLKEKQQMNINRVHITRHYLAFCLHNKIILHFRYHFVNLVHNEALFDSNKLFQLKIFLCRGIMYNSCFNNVNIVTSFMTDQIKE